MKKMNMTEITRFVQKVVTCFVLAAAMMTGVVTLNAASDFAVK